MRYVYKILFILSCIATVIGALRIMNGMNVDSDLVTSGFVVLFLSIPLAFLFNSTYKESQLKWQKDKAELERLKYYIETGTTDPVLKAIYDIDTSEIKKNKEKDNAI